MLPDGLAKRVTFLGVEHREEGGTPAIVESIRAGLVFALKERVGVDAIRTAEHKWIRRAIESWMENPKIRVLGDPAADRLSIVSFLIVAPDHLGSDRYLHHNFVVTVLNDLFGIQARGGCSCAGPYGHRLLGIDDSTSSLFESEIVAGCELIKPGWVRINFNYFITEDEFQYLVEAVHLVAESGWRLLPSYRFDLATGEWVHRDRIETASRSLTELFSMERPDRLSVSVDQLDHFLEEAVAILAGPPVQCEPIVDLPQSSESLRWFPLPFEVE